MEVWYFIQYICGDVEKLHHVFLFFQFVFMNIFVAKLDYGTNDSELRDAFEAFGEVSSAKVIMDRETQRSKGFGFVEMPDDAQGQEAIDALDGSEMDGRTIVVKKARPREDNRRGGGGGGGGFRNNDRFNRY